MNDKLRSNVNKEDFSVRIEGGDGAGTKPLKEQRKNSIFYDAMV